MLRERSTRAVCESTWLCCLTDSKDTWKPSEREREQRVKATAAPQGHALCTTLSFSSSLSFFLSLSLCPLLCGKNRSTDLSVQLFSMLLTFTWISPGAAAVGSRLAFVYLCSCLNTHVFAHTLGRVWICTCAE